MAKLISNGTTVPHASGHEDLVNRLVKWLTGVGYPSFTGSGGVQARYLRAKPSAVDETWTLVCTNAGTGTFSVTGSVSGAQASATVGVPYDNGKVAFTLTNVTSAAVLSDQIVFTSHAGTLVAAGQAWALIKQTAPVTDEIHVFLRGLGNAGTDQIFVGLRTYKNVAQDYFNVELFGGTGYLETQTRVSAMPGVSPSGVNVCMLNGSMPYWFVANGRRFTFVVKVSTVYESAYMGFLLPTGTPNEYPYPLVVGGSHSAENRRWSDNQAAGSNGSLHRAFFNPNGALKVRDKGGTWMNFQNYNFTSSELVALGNRTTPFGDLKFHQPLGGSYVLYPVTMHCNSPSANVLGDFEGVFVVSGISNPSENIVQSGGVDHLVVQNTYRTDAGEYAAFKLE